MTIQVVGLVWARGARRDAALLVESAALSSLLGSAVGVP